MTKTTLKCIQLSFYTSLFLLLLSHANSQLNVHQEQSILLKIKQHWQNPQPLGHWTPSSNSSSHCSWPEITCSTDGSVTGLFIEDNNIIGTVPPFICDLKNLTILDLTNNSLASDEFPRALYNCSKLQYLNLSQNYFAGTIPDEIHHMAQLRQLNLGANSFSGNIPASIGQLTELTALQLFQIQFNGSFPPEIGNLSNLERLELAYMTRITTTLPLEFTKLKKLKFLWVAGSNLVGEIPDKIGEMVALEHLDLSMNNLSGKIPSKLFMLKNLSIVYLFLNNLSGEIPRVVEALNIDVIDLSENSLTGTIPDDFGRLTKLSGLALFFNQLSGKIPDSIGNLPGLINLKLFNNSLSGTLPPDLGRYSMLEVFQVASNYRLTGQLPQHLGDNGRLFRVVASDNNLSGELPKSLGNCKNLIILSVQNNRFSGNIPSGLWTLLSLSILQLSNNSFKGELPERLSNLIRLEMSHNRFSGKIPAGVSWWRKLVFLDASNNLLNGTIPQEIAATNLTTLLLANNQLSGKIPTGVSSLRNLGVLDVSNNLLDGTIPQEIAALPQLAFLLLANNQLSGEIPTGSVSSWGNLLVLNASNNLLNGTIPQEIATLPHLTTLLLANNRLSGKIPTQVSSWRNLGVLDVSNNLLDGTIPQEIAALLSLTILLLDRNRLSGSLPSNILSWKLLNTLNLSRNAFSGQIPEEFGSLPSLIHLDLSENQLSGQIPPRFGILNLISLNLSSNHLTGRVPSGFDNGVYVRSFLNNPGLCAFTSSVTDDKCNSKSSKISVRFLVLIICLVIATLVLALFFVIKIVMRRKQGLVLTWKLTSFQRLNFTGSDIMAGLTENNVIGCGGSGTVYRVAVNPSRDIAAVNPSCDFVAVKKIWSNGMLEHKLEKQFLAEVRTLSSIRHSKIVKLLCFISNDDSKLLVYEYLENGSLDLWLHRQSGASTVLDSVQEINLDWPKRLQIAVGAAQGLSYMHHDCSQPIVHRDVKSSNILLDSEFNAKIADFGLAKMLIKHGESATTSVVAGSFGYIAPEYAQTGRVNKKIDVYSFGVVLLELTTGRKASDGDENTSLVQWAWRQNRENKPIIDVLDEEVRKPCNSDEMCSVFKLGILCTSTNPSERPSMKEVLKNLRRQQPAPNRGSSSPNGSHSGSGQRPTCQVCGRLGHTALVCNHRFDQTYQADGPNLSAHTVATSQSQDLNLYPDSGATHHIISNLSNLNIHSEESNGPNQIQAGNTTRLLQESQ